MIYLFTVACSDRASTSWWARLFASDRSYCYDRLTDLLEPESTQAARFEWLDTLSEGDDFEVAQRHAVLRGYPDYFQRLWEVGRTGPFHIGNSDDAVERLLPGLWLLWPDMRFLLSYRNGVAAMDAKVGAADEEFARACREWATRVAAMKTHGSWLEERGAEVRETHLERLVEREDELRDIWTAIPGEWEDYAEEKRSLLGELAAELEPADAMWERWPAGRRRTFEETCGSAQVLLGYWSAPEPSGRRRWPLARR